MYISIYIHTYIYIYYTTDETSTVDILIPISFHSRRLKVDETKYCFFMYPVP